MAVRAIQFRFEYFTESNALGTFQSDSCVLDLETRISGIHISYAFQRAQDDASRRCLCYGNRGRLAHTYSLELIQRLFTCIPQVLLETGLQIVQVKVGLMNSCEYFCEIIPCTVGHRDATSVLSGTE